MAELISGWFVRDIYNDASGVRHRLMHLHVIIRNTSDKFDSYQRGYKYSSNNCYNWSEFDKDDPVYKSSGNHIRYSGYLLSYYAENVNWSDGDLNNFTKGCIYVYGASTILNLPVYNYDSTVPGVVSNVSVSNITRSSALVSFNNPTFDPGAYLVVLRSNDVNIDIAYINGLDDSISLYDLSPDTTYEVRIYTESASGKSSPYTYTTFTTLPTATITNIGFARDNRTNPNTPVITRFVDDQAACSVELNSIGSIKTIYVIAEVTLSTRGLITLQINYKIDNTAITPVNFAIDTSNDESDDIAHTYSFDMGDNYTASHYTDLTVTQL